MFRWRRVLPLFFLAAAAQAQNPPTGIDFANLQEDVRGLSQKVDALTLQLEQLQPHPGFTAPAPDLSSYATLVQLNAAVADLNRAIQAAVAASQQETLYQTNAQLKKLAEQVNADTGSSAEDRARRLVAIERLRGLLTPEPSA